MASNRNLRLQVLLDAVDRVSGPMKKVVGGTSTAAKALRAAQGELKKLNETQRSVDGFRKLEGQLGQTSAELTAAQRKLAQLTSEVNAAESPNRKLMTALKRQARVVGTLNTAQQRQRTQLVASRSALQGAGIDTNRLAVHQRKLSTNIERANAQLAEQKTRLWRLNKAQATARKMHSGGMTTAAHGAGLAYGGQRLLRGAVAPVGAAMRFESAMADVRKVVDFDTPAQFQQMARDVEDLSMRLPMSAEGIAQIVAAAGQANIARGELLRFAEDAAKMGVAFDSTAEEAGSTMATWRTAFRMNQGQVMQLADQVNYLGNTGPASVAKISDVLTRVGALGEVGGLASGQVAALGATVAGMGIASEVSATGIKNLILRLTAGEAATKRQRKVFKQLGLDATGMAEAMQEDAGGAIITVLERLRELPAAQQNAAMSQLFGTESIGAIAPLLTNLDLLRENLNKVGDAQRYAGSMSAEYASRVATSENSLQLLKNTAAVLAQSLGETLLGDFKTVAARTGVVVERVVEWIRANPALVKTLAKVAIIGAVLVTVLGGLLVAGGVAAMAFGQIHAAIAILSGGTGVLGLVKSLGGLAGKALPMVGRAIMLVGRAMLLNPIGLVLTAIAAVAYLIYRNWDTIGPKLAAIWDVVWARIKVIWDAIKSYVLGAWDVIAGIFTGDGDRIRSGLVTMWESINTLLGGWPAKFMQFGIDMIAGLVRGIGNMAGAVKDAVVGTVSGAVDKFKNLLGIHSPSRLFARFGDYTMQGFAGGLDRSQKRPLQAMATLGQRMRQAGAGVAIGAAAMPAVAIDNRPPVSTASSAAAAPTYHISITAPAGSQAQDIATLVRQEIERLERDRAARTRSRLGDYD